MGKLKNKIKAGNEKDWEEEVYRKSTLKCYRLAKDDPGVERYVRLVQGEESVRLQFRLRPGSAGLLEDKKRCRRVSDERYVMCASRGGCGSFPAGLWGI